MIVPSSLIEARMVLPLTSLLPPLMPNHVRPWKLPTYVPRSSRSLHSVAVRPPPTATKRARQSPSAIPDICSAPFFSGRWSSM